MYYTSLYNGIDNDLNIAYNGILYPYFICLIKLEN